MAKNKHNQNKNGKSPTQQNEEIEDRVFLLDQNYESDEEDESFALSDASDEEFSENSEYSDTDLDESPGQNGLTASSSSIATEEYLNSVFKVLVKTKNYNYEHPWNPPKLSSHHGSGFAVYHEDQVFLLTNAHVASEIGSMKVRLSDSSEEYKAEVVLIEHDCDLALIKVTDPKFHKDLEPLELGSMVKRTQPLSIHGFPMGGSEYCVTDGKVSRIEVDTYAEAGTNLIQAQVSAPINPGNSGGPAISGGKIVGVAFQGLDSGDNIGYIIPTEVIKHFLKEALNPETYKGFPDLHFKYQEIKNEYLRKHYGLEDDQSGIRVKSVPKLSAARGFLKPDDIILEIDGHKVSSDGHVDTDGLKRVDLDYLITRHFIGDNIQFKILRDKKELELDIPLKNRSGTTKKVQYHFEKAPSYYFVSGIALCTLTDNLFESSWTAGTGLINLAEKQKRRAGEEIVYIKSVLDCDHNDGYEDYEEEVISRINGKRIHNLREAIQAVETNKSDVHKIKTKSGHVIIVPNLSKNDHKALLKEYSIYRDRSDDLKRPPQIKPGCPEHNALLLQYETQRALSSSTSLSHDVSEEVEKRKVKHTVTH